LQREVLFLNVGLWILPFTVKSSHFVMISDFNFTWHSLLIFVELAPLFTFPYEGFFHLCKKNQMVIFCLSGENVSAFWLLLPNLVSHMTKYHCYICKVLLKRKEKGDGGIWYHRLQIHIYYRQDFSPYFCFLGNLCNKKNNSE
jgi:hypothetical protein